MCRWLAYTGGAIPMGELIFNTRHSLIDQSLSATSSVQVTNGDGFGVGWYDHLSTPGLYKNIQPAWNDANLHDLCTHIRSPLFLAHVRASTGTAIQHSNCHPFRSGSCLFVHNGAIREFARVKRALSIELSDDYFRQLEGNTDSELMFLLAMQFGMAENVYAGIARMVGFVEKAAWAAGVKHPIQMTLGISEGERLHAVRYSSEQDSRTLFLSRNIEALRAELGPRGQAVAEQLTDEARCIVSEPLSELQDFWQLVPESTYLVVEHGKVETRPFHPEVP
jgi:predicted glutamine amidotransferase